MDTTEVVGSVDHPEFSTPVAPALELDRTTLA
jgi:hypothetical protein